MAYNLFKKFNITVEVPVFLFFFALTFCDSVKSNLIIFRTCYALLGYDKEECSLLGSQNPDNQTAKLEKIVEPYASVVNMINMLSEGLCSAAMCLFLGPWSDRFGRKPVLVVPLIGYFLYYLLTMGFSLLERLSPWYTVMCWAPVCLTGGLSSFLTASLCHITDSTRDEKRGMKMGVVEFAFYMGIFLGTASSSYIFAATNYATVFSIGAFCCLMGLVYTIFCIPESLADRETEGRFKNFFDLSNITEMVKVTFKKRDNYGRYTVLSCMLMTTLIGVIISGTKPLTFLFLREKFHWSLQKFTLFSAYDSSFLAFGTLVGVYILHKLMKFPETIIMLVSMLSLLNGSLMMGLAQSDWLIYVVPVAKLLGGIFEPMVKLLISKIIPKDEIGKIFAVLTTSMFLFGFVGSPVYTFIYNETITINPGIFYFVNSGIVLFQIIVLIGVIIVRTINSRSYKILLNEEVAEEQLVDSDVIR